MTSAHADLQQARKTALSVGTVLLALGGWSWWRVHPWRAGILAGAGACLLLLGLAAPRWARPFHLVWMRFAALLGYVNSRLILGLMYYGVFTPLGFFLKLAGRDPLRRRGAFRQKQSAESYWIARSKPRQDREQFERLF